VDYPKVHRLETLLDLLAARGRELPDDLADVTRLTPFATVFRYDDLPLEADIDRDGLLPLVRKVSAFIEARIGDVRE
jgi:hypothetical protein